MSRLKDVGVKKRRPHPTSIDGLFIRDMSLDEYRQRANELDGAGDDFAWLLYDRFICDENGDRFEDYPNQEDGADIPVSQILAFKTVFEEFVAGLGKSPDASDS